MNANESTCHPGDGTKGLNRLPYRPSLCCDSISSKICKSFDEKTRGVAKRDVVRRPWQSTRTSGSFWSS